LVKPERIAITLSLNHLSTNPTNIATLGSKLVKPKNEPLSPATYWLYAGSPWPGIFV
jgi:hypothetical protein